MAIFGPLESENRSHCIQKLSARRTHSPNFTPLLPSNFWEINFFLCAIYAQDSCTAVERFELVHVDSSERSRRTYVEASSRGGAGERIQRPMACGEAMATASNGSDH